MHTAMHEADAFDFSWLVQYGQHGMSPSSPIAIGTLSTTAGLAVGAAATATDTAIKIAKLVRSADTIIPIFERSALCVNRSGTLNVTRRDADVDREPDPGMCRFREPPGMDMSGILSKQIMPLLREQKPNDRTSFPYDAGTMHSPPRLYVTSKNGHPRADCLV